MLEIEAVVYPYEALKTDVISYTILLLHEQEALPFQEIVPRVGLSTARVRARYDETKQKQAQLYCGHIAHLAGEGPEAGAALAAKLYACYRSYKHVAAWLESQYPGALAAYRAGEAGMPAAMLRGLAPFRQSFGKRTVSRVVALREQEGKAFPQIAAQLRMTSEQARHLYRCYYSDKARVLLDAIEAATGEYIRHSYYRASRSPKQRYEHIVRDYPDFVQPKKPL